MLPDFRRLIGGEEFDYQALMSVLSNYANPREKVTSLLRANVIIRVKKGLYVFGDSYRRRPFSREVLANLIYGPSFISLDYALSYYGLIPERVQTMTSTTTKRSRRFDTPVGSFVYRNTPERAFHFGMDRLGTGDISFLIAVPERALSDKLRDDRGTPLGNHTEVAEYLFDDLRVDRTSFLAMDPIFFEKFGAACGSRKVVICGRLLARMKGRQ